MIIVDRQDDLGEWLSSKIGASYASGSYTCIGYEKNGTIMAVVAFENYNGSSMVCHLAIDRFNIEWAMFCWDYIFNQLKIKKLIGVVDSSNQKALKLDLHFGFIEEYIIKDAGKDGDLHILSMTKEQCKMLNK